MVNFVSVFFPTLLKHTCSRDLGLSFLGMKLSSFVYSLSFFLVSVHLNIRIIITLLTAEISAGFLFNSILHLTELISSEEVNVIILICKISSSFDFFYI